MVFSFVSREFICWFTDVDRSRGSEVVTVFRRPAKKELSVAPAVYASRFPAVLSSSVPAFLLPWRVFWGLVRNHFGV